jgi:hypothetical protein
MTNLEYWKESVESSLEEHGVVATDEQITAIAEDMQGSHENIGQAFYEPHGSDRRDDEIKGLKRQLQDEREKVPCKVCNSTGRITTYGGTLMSISSCWKCSGEGRHKP